MPKQRGIRPVRRPLDLFTKNRLNNSIQRSAEGQLKLALMVDELRELTRKLKKKPKRWMPTERFREFGRAEKRVSAIRKEFMERWFNKAEIERALNSKTSAKERFFGQLKSDLESIAASSPAWQTEIDRIKNEVMQWNFVKTKEDVLFHTVIEVRKKLGK